MAKSSGSFIPVVFVLTLLLLLSILSGAVIIAGNNAYKKIADSMDENYDKRVSLSYVVTKIRQNDVIGRIHTETKDGVDMLAINESFGDFHYVTYLYYYNDFIREIYLFADEYTEFELGDGLPIISAGGLAFETDSDSIKLSVTDTIGRTQSVTVTLRSGME